MYKGATSVMVDGAMGGGYDGARFKCAQAFPDTTTVHMCTSEELLRSRHLNMTITASGWYSTGAAFTGPGPITYYDCQGWTSNTNQQAGGYWIGHPQFDGCDKSHVILCCD